MNEIKLLTLLELRSLYGINKYRHTKDKKEKRRYIALATASTLLIVMICFYVGALVYGLCSLNLSDIVPAYLTMIAALLIFMFGIFKTGSTLFSPKGYDLLTSMPLRPMSVILSRFLRMYTEELLLTLLIFLPGTILYGICVRPNILFYLITLFGILLIPAIPLVLSTIFGTLVTAISSRMKHKSLTQTFLMLVFLILILVGSFVMGNSAETYTPEVLTNFAATVGNTITSIYPPAAWLGNIIVSQNIPALLLFLGVSILPMSLTILTVSKNYLTISRRLFSTMARHSYQMETLKTCTLLKTLYLRELKRYFSSSI